MSFVDWVDETQHRYQEQPLTRATVDSVREFYRGLSARAKWSAVYLLASGSVRSTLAGESVQFVVDSPDDLKRAENGLHEDTVLKWLLAGTGPETVFWDVGGFHGTYSVVAASKGADVIAFEPAPENMERLAQNAALNGLDIDQREVAISDETGTREFDTGADRESELSIVDDGDLTVDTRRGDDLDSRPDVVKIDVEGHELSVLDGMAETLESVDRIVVEVHEGVDPFEVRSRLRSAGLTTTEVTSSRSQSYIGGART